jgi:peptidyl-prolyl cis-trans isomerase C
MRIWSFSPTLSWEHSLALIVNGEYVSDHLIFEELRHMDRDAPSANDAISQHETEILQRAAEQRVVHRVLLRQMAVREGLPVSDAEVDAERRQRWGSSSNAICGTGVEQSFRNDLLIARMCDKLTRHVPRPTRMEVDRFYLANPENFYQPERVHAAHIIRNVDLSETESEPKAALKVAEAELAAGKPFAKVATRCSDCRGAGGDLGWIVRGEMVAEFDDVVFELKIGDRSPIFRTVFGLHIATVLERKPAGVQPLEEIRHSLALSLLEGRRQREIDRVLINAMRHSQIQVAPASDAVAIVAEERRR